MPENMIYHEYLLDHEIVGEDKKERWAHWSPENGYDSAPVHHDLGDDLSREELPRRSIAPGVFGGLTIAMNVDRNEHVCASTSSVGLRVSIFVQNSECFRIRK